MVEKRSVSVIIPVYREEKKIKRCIRESIAFFERNERIGEYEIIFVADRSGDRTVEIIRDTLKSQPRIRLIVNDVRLEKGGSVREGILNAAQADLYLFYDADLSTPLCELDRFLPLMDDFDIVIGSRAMKGADIRKSRLKRLVSGILSIINRLFMGIRVRDTQCGFKIFTARCRELFERLTVRSSAFDIELLYIAVKRNFKIKEIPVSWVDSEVSNFNQFKVVFHFIRDFLRIRYNDLRGLYS